MAAAATAPAASAPGYPGRRRPTCALLHPAAPEAQGAAEQQKARRKKIMAMTPDKIAPMAVYLASDASKEVSGQIFAVRKDEIFLMSQPRPIRSAHKDGGWSPEDIAATMLPAFQSGFYPLDRSADVFNWEPL